MDCLLCGKNGKTVIGIREKKRNEMETCPFLVEPDWKRTFLIEKVHRQTPCPTFEIRISKK